MQTAVLRDVRDKMSDRKASGQKSAAETAGMTAGSEKTVLADTVPEKTVPQGAGSGRPWILRDRMFSEKHMYAFVENYTNGGDAPQSAAALPYARHMHMGQYRAGEGRIPYIYHPLMMACHALALGFNEDEIIAAALLHDVLEDCTRPDGSPVTAADLPDAVGDNVRAAVQLVTKPDVLHREADPDWEQKYYGRISLNRLAVIVKILDRCSNISTMTTGFSRGKMVRYITETEKYVLPLIDILKTTYRDTCYNQAFLLKYQMKSILEGLKRVL